MDDVPTTNRRPTELGRPRDERSAVVAELMARMATGDSAAVFDLVDRFGPELRAAVSRVAVSRGAHLDRQALDDLALDVGLELNDLARAWRPDAGALPWTWARHRVAAVVDRHLGQWCSSLDVGVERTEKEDGPVPSAHEARLVDVMRRMGSTEPLVELLFEALELVLSERDRQLFLEVEVQQALGDRSPATTVGPMLGMQPAAVRQQYRRARLRLRRLAGTDPHYAPLADLPIVA